MRLLWEEEAWEDYCLWQTRDKKLLKRINSLIKDIQRNTYEGIGKPEPLKGDLSGWWSRRIDDTHRIVYREQDGNIIIASCYGHYTDTWETKRLLSADSSLFVLWLNQYSAPSATFIISVKLFWRCSAVVISGETKLSEMVSRQAAFLPRVSALANRAKLSISTQRQPRSSRSSSQ